MYPGNVIPKNRVLSAMCGAFGFVFGGFGVVVVGCVERESSIIFNTGSTVTQRR